MNKDIFYGLLRYSSINIGDEIQSIAASRFLPRVDRYIRRERISKYKSSKKTKLIMNAWWMWNQRFFPPSEDIEPLLISMYIRAAIRDTFLTDKTKKYLIEHGPVGCRDKSTEKYLQENGIPAYFSGCLTLTLEKNPEIKKRDFILTVDIPEYIQNEIRKRTSRPVYNISRMLFPICSGFDRFRLANAMLNLYQSAHCVVSRRLHVAMPSLAFETPFLLLDTNDNTVLNDPRFEGVIELCNYYKEIDFIYNKDLYDFDNPPPNPPHYRKIKEDLIKRCSEFTGYNNPESLLIKEPEPLITILQLLEYKYKNVKRALWWAEPKDLILTFIKKVFFKMDKHDLNY